MLSNTKRKGFTLIELLIVVVIIGILAAIAIPKFANTKDKAKLASVKSDVRNLMNTMEGVAAGNNSQYRAPTSPADYTLTPGNTLTASAFAVDGYSFTITNASITTGQNSCSVAVGAGAANDGVITCAGAAAPAP